ncbi:hypothetical protein TNCV_3666661 [Trichonephila clavipes]|nr:hypothetical protein TNCV_3666661 [Trichonephila clavipes]
MADLCSNPKHPQPKVGCYISLIPELQDDIDSYILQLDSTPPYLRSTRLLRTYEKTSLSIFLAHGLDESRTTTCHSHVLQLVLT